MKVRTVVLVLGTTALLLAGPVGQVAANSGPSSTTFAQVVARSRLIVLAGVRHRADGGNTLDIERMLKGRSGSVLRFSPSLQAAIQPGWSRVIVDFSDPTTLDFRAPTIAWHVAADGTIDPERFQQSRGIPQTLAAMLAWFNDLPATDAPPTDSATVAGDWRLVIITLAGLAGFAGGIRHLRSR